MTIMYCPNCAALIDGVKFCRTCGANVSLVPQALTGQILVPDPPATIEPESSSGRHHRRSDRPATIERAVAKFFTGIGFLIASIIICFRFPGGFTWGWSFLFPAFALIGEGIGQYLKVQEQRRQLMFNQSGDQAFNQLGNQLGNRPANYQSPSSQTPMAVVPANPSLPAPTTSQLASPPSVVEHTTKHLDAAQPRE